MRDRSIVHPVEKFYPGRIDDVLEVCEILRQKDITVKKFLCCYFLADNPKLASKRRIWGTDGGWSSTLKVVLGLRATACQQPGGDQLWNGFILDEAKRIVQSQEPPRGYAPQGGYYSSETITKDFFLENNCAIRESLLETSMPFLYELINAKILSSIDTSDDEDIAESVLDGQAEDEDNDMPEDVAYSKPKSHRQMKMLQSTTVPKTICAMIAYVCNRRCNGMAIHNGLTFLACGASERINEFLNFIGLSVSRQTTLKVADTL
ncbi:hypothetical protein DFH28DRAFT_861496, partial [Melampsora americana]